MRVLLSRYSKNKLFNHLKKKYSVKSLKELSRTLKIPFKTLNNWLYEKNRYLPLDVVPEKLGLKIIDKKPDNWGKIKGGKKTYQILIKKYGINEMKKRQSKGGKVSLLKRDNQAKKDFRINIDNVLFLEFYGALLGDGWLSSLSYDYKNKKTLWWVGISGHSELDRDYLMFLKDIIKKVFYKNVIVKYKKKSKAMEILFCHKQLILFMNKELGFPIGKKIDLKIENEIAQEWNKVKYVIRGIFDTDGSLYFDKTPVGKPYPVISVHMKSTFIIKSNKQTAIISKF